MELQTDDFLTQTDLDAVLAVVLNLAAEVVELQERVRVLEGADVADQGALQQRIDDLVTRVARPMHAGRDLL